MHFSRAYDNSAYPADTEEHEHPHVLTSGHDNRYRQLPRELLRCKLPFLVLRPN